MKNIGWIQTIRIPLQTKSSFLKYSNGERIASPHSFVSFHRFARSDKIQKKKKNVPFVPTLYSKRWQFQLFETPLLIYIFFLQIPLQSTLGESTNHVKK